LGPKYDLIGLSSKEVGPRSAGRVDHRVGLGAGCEGAVLVGVVRRQIVRHGVYDRLGNVCATRDIGEYRGPLSQVVLQGGEVLAYLVDVECAHSPDPSAGYAPSAH
jgi:hypothetical protein